MFPLIILHYQDRGFLILLFAKNRILSCRWLRDSNVDKFCYLQPDFCQNNSAGVHANPDDCYGFIMCDMAGIAHEMDCPAGLKFNPAILVCDWPNNVECEDGSGEPAGH